MAELRTGIRQSAAPAGSAHVDVLIVGAGLSGIGAAYHLQAKLPRKSYAILEARSAMGGTWDLFRYPGVRSDSDMHTLGFSFRPWLDERSIADGAAIAGYIRDTAAAYGIDRKIRFSHKVVQADWSSTEARWTVDVSVEAAPGLTRFTCGFLFMCSGYFDYEEGYLPHWPRVENYAGTMVHPQAWPEDLDYAGKRIVVIGSGATAVTLVPALARTAAHVTMLQRSPTYVVARPAKDPHAARLYKWLPKRLAHPLVRWKNVLLSMYFYNLARRNPQRVKAGIQALIRRQLGPDFDVATHFSPRYDPWDQRLCLVPDADLFRALRKGRASMVTGVVEQFTPTGIALASGEQLQADIIVAATGLNLIMLGGAKVTVDGNPVDFSRTLNYKGMMFSDVPNLALASGYANASWTLKAELSARYVCRLLAHMDARGYAKCVPRRGADAQETDEPAFSLSSGYIQRSVDRLPKQGAEAPWRVYQNYARDLAAIRFGSIEDGVMEFSRPAPSAKAA